MRPHKLFLSFTGLLLAGVASCGGGGGDDWSDIRIPPQSPGGIWSGTERFSSGETYALVGIVTEAGSLQFLDEQGQRMFGAVTTGEFFAMDGAGNWALPIGVTTAEGSAYGAFTVNGDVVERSRFSGDFSSEGNQGDTYSGTFSLGYDEIYERNSSLEIISGTYQSGTESLTIDSQGRIFGQDPTSGCVFNGNVSIIDPEYNAYQIDFDASNCTAEYAQLNGLEFSGLATLDNSDPSEEVLIVLVDAALDDGYVAGAGLYSKQ